MESAGSAFTFGLGKNGELGNAMSSDRELVPFRIPKVSAVTRVAAGNGFSLILTASGVVFATGKSKDGRSGLPQDTAVPRAVTNLANIRDIACGYWHAVAIDNSGRLFATGHNKHGELGLGDVQDRVAFTVVENVDDVAKAVCGQHVTILILGSGTALTTGKQSVNGLSRDSNVYTELQLGEAVRSVACGTVHCAAVTATGKVFTWGNGAFGQLGHNSRSSSDRPREVEALRGIDVTQVSCSRGEKYGHTACVDSSRNVYTWGSGYKGKLGLDAHWSHEDPADRLEPTKIEGFQADWVECGGIHSTAISGNQLYTWGCGSDGRLGHPECEGHRYLYKEPLPRAVQSLGEAAVLSISSSYYHNILVAR